MKLTRRATVGLGIRCVGVGGVGAFTLGLLPSPALARPAMVEAGREDITIQAQPIGSFLPRLPGQTRFGQLTFRSGLVLSSPERRFGGFSGLWRSPDGERLVAISDNAHWLTATVSSSGGALTGLDQARLSPMLNASGRPLSRTRSYDTEALCIDGGLAYVSVERTHEILRFDFGRRGVASRGQPVPVPPEIKQLPGNRGLEAVGVVPPGSPLAGALVALSERSAGQDEPTLGLIVGGPNPGLLRYRLTDGYEVTDLAFLAGGDMLVLERWYRPWRGVGMRIRRVPGRTIASGALLDGVVLMEADLGHEIDNMEGLSVHRAAGRTILTMISDDNFSALQRTLLLEFELADG